MGVYRLRREIGTRDEFFIGCAKRAGHAMSFYRLRRESGTRLDIFYRLRREDGIGCLPNGRIIYYHAHTPRGMGARRQRKEEKGGKS